MIKRSEHNRFAQEVIPKRGNPKLRGGKERERKRERAAKFSDKKVMGEGGTRRAFSGWRGNRAKDKGNKWEVH